MVPRSLRMSSGSPRFGTRSFGRAISAAVASDCLALALGLIQQGLLMLPRSYVRRARLHRARSLFRDGLPAGGRATSARRRAWREFGNPAAEGGAVINPAACAS